MSVPFAADYPFLNVLWSMLIFVALLLWIWLAITCFIDIFRRSDMGGFAKAIWIVFIIILPYLGILVYLIVYHQGMAERSAKTVQANQEAFDTAFDDRVREAAGSGGAAAEIEKAHGLLQSGAITQAEFDGIKEKALRS